MIRFEGNDKKLDFLKRNFKPPPMQKWQCLIYNGTLKALTGKGFSSKETYEF